MMPTLAQAASWTRVASIVTAARVIEKRTDQFTPHFFLAFPDDELLQTLIVRVLAYLIRGYAATTLDLQFSFYYNSEPPREPAQKPKVVPVVTGSQSSDHNPVVEFHLDG
jgi:hypothetical protein